MTLTRDDWKARAAALKPETRMFIDGEFVDALSGATFPTINPATGEVVAEVARGTAADVDRAVASAKRAFRDGRWSRLDPRDRMTVLSRFADLIEANAESFALLDTLDMGKPISDMLNIDVPGSVSNIRFFAEVVDKTEGAVTNTTASALHYILRQPLGVCGIVVPWNYPLMMAAWKLGPALAAGNSVVLKPAEQSPLSALLLAKLFMEAGGPAGILNVVTGFGEETGKPLALHMDVDKIGFTGSGEVGKLMLIYAGQSNMKRVTNECGGKSPQVILADCEDLDTAAATAVSAIYGNQGEVCSAGSRLLVERPIYDAFIEKFTEVAKTAHQPGDPLDPATTMGPLVTPEQQDRVLRYIDIGQKEGANLAFGGAVPAGLNAGCYVEPTLFTNVANSMRIAQEEIFGPVASVIPVDNVDHAISVANDTIYGLAASIWTSNVKTAHRFARDIEAGIVWVNAYEAGDATTPWGGFKQSGNGRDKCLEALSQYSQTKSVWIDLR
ncbi:gamma-glutamyl-gamma-aminobutyraldehyde dehydrogenase [Gemmobacter aquatilis]|uniref:Gamma-glutamyl-gamma-aminobutyraldehyde dehydrogenase n=1 Tax=Gemmobacter aquatilis TaxID=933059 RepID=A0A1H8A2C2_9RHOB|nr:aldehyde dehydrogenase [Gemmobacter aquatilis]SEM64683.1 gamma-glutamyl-gamma-aminobutyraldehyde dehydrogenase [Gemmobacter aquatilis]